jgi:hypothetical protein
MKQPFNLAMTQCAYNWIGGVMVSILASCAGDRGLEP